MSTAVCVYLDDIPKQIQKHCSAHCHTYGNIILQVEGNSFLSEGLEVLFQCVNLRNDIVLNTNSMLLKIKYMSRKLTIFVFESDSWSSPHQC